MYLSFFLVFLLFKGLPGLHVQGPSGPLETQYGASVILPCFTQDPLPLKGLQVEWRKTESDSLVNIFQQGESKPQLQSEAFRVRVHFFPDEIPKGNFSILLQNVVKNDTGVYRCKVTTFHDAGETLVKVGNDEHLVVTGSDHVLSAFAGDEVVLNCSVGSNVPIHEIQEVTWKRTDRDVLILLYQDNKTFAEASHESYQGRAEFFVKEIPKGNFSLKLKDVQIEDKGEYTCEVHTRQHSGHTVVVLQRLGFSLLHKLMLLFYVVVVLLAFGLGFPVFVLLIRKATNENLMRMNTFLVLGPTICMCAAFIMWSTEDGFLWETMIFAAVSITRPLLLLKTFPAFERFPMHLAKAVKTLTFPVYQIFLTVAIYTSFFMKISWGVLRTEPLLFSFSIVMGVSTVISCIGAVILAGYYLRIHSTVCLEMCNLFVLAIILAQGSENPMTCPHVAATTSPLNIAILMVLSLQRHYFQGKPFQCIHIALSSVIVTVFTLAQIGVFIVFGIKMTHFSKAWAILFEALMCVILWTAVCLLVRYHKHNEQGCCSQHREKGYLCCAVVVALLMFGYAAVCLHYIGAHLKNEKDQAGYMALTAQTHVLAAASFFQHPTKLPYLPHVIIYMFGAVGLNIINAITLAAALILKAGKGERVIEDLSLIVLPFETIFMFAWLALQIYEEWMRTGKRIKQNFLDNTEGDSQVPQEMEALSGTNKIE